MPSAVGRIGASFPVEGNWDYVSFRRSAPAPLSDALLDVEESALAFRHVGGFGSRCFASLPWAARHRWIRFNRRGFSCVEKKNKWRGVTILMWTGGQGHPTPNHTQTHPQHSNICKKYQKCEFSQFSTRWPRTNGPTDGRTDGPTDKASYRVACPQLKTQKWRT